MQPSQTVLFLYFLVFPSFCPSPSTDLLFLYTERRRSPLILGVLVSSGFCNTLYIGSYFVTPHLQNNSQTSVDVWYRIMGLCLKLQYRNNPKISIQTPQINNKRALVRHQPRTSHRPAHPLRPRGFPGKDRKPPHLNRQAPQPLAPLLRSLTTRRLKRRWTFDELH